MSEAQATEAQAQASEAQSAEQSASTRGRRQTQVGTVVANKMDKTVVVAVETQVMHRLYHRSMKRTRKFYAHDEENACGVGDRVEIVSSRPLSRLKRWRVRRVLSQAEGS